MSLTNTTPEDEQFVLSGLVTKIQNLIDLANVFDRLRFVNSKSDLVSKTMIVPDAKKEVRYACFEFLGYDDDTTEGDDDCPVIILIYRLHLFFQFVDVRADSSNSAREFTGAILVLRKDFLESRDLLEPDSPRKGVIESFQKENNAALQADSLTGITGHSIDFLVRVKHYGY